MYRSLHLDSLIKNEITSLYNQIFQSVHSCFLLELFLIFGLFENTLVAVTSNLWEFHGFISDKIWTWLEENNYELKSAVEEGLPSLLF